MQSLARLQKFTSRIAPYTAATVNPKIAGTYTMHLHYQKLQNYTYIKHQKNNSVIVYKVLVALFHFFVLARHYKCNFVM